MQRKRRILGTLVIALPLALTIGTCERPQTYLERVMQRGELRVAIRNSPTVYYLGQYEQELGFSYDLVRGFANFLGLKLKLIEPDSFSEIIPLVETGDVHIAAAGLTVTQERAQSVRFGPPVLRIHQQVVYRQGSEKPESIVDLVGKDFEVVANSSHSERLRQIKKSLPTLEWRENLTDDGDELLYRVAEGDLGYTMTDSNLFAINARYYPKLRVAMSLGHPEDLAWAMRKEEDDSLYNKAVEYLANMERNGELEFLRARYFGQAERLTTGGANSFSKLLTEKLPTYRPLFEEAAEKYDLDWRLLAAVGFQESHWNPNAKSPTGVRGLMMLTRHTAKFVGIADRTDPEQSIFGGAKYIDYLRTRIGEEISEPDRTWLTLASYNIGIGHLRDAQQLVRDAGGDPDLWEDVRRMLPLLMKPEWHKKTKYGYARGREALNYVENIRVFYDIIVHHSERELGEPDTEEIAPPLQDSDTVPFINIPPAL